MATGSLSAEPTVTKAEPVTQATLPEAIAAMPAQPVEPLPAVTIEVIPLTAEPDVIAALAPTDTAHPEAEPEPETLQPENQDISAEAVAVSRRPTLRPDTLNVPAAAPQAVRKNPAPQRSQPQGNADRAAHAGQTSGSETARAASSGSGGKSAQTGNAAASNYPGQVMRKLSRVALPRVDARGTAMIAFRIADNGGLAALSIARSSGSAALDQAALRVVQRATPFPPPPSGARRSFSIPIKAR